MLLTVLPDPASPPVAEAPTCSCASTSVDCLTWVRVAGEVDLSAVAELTGVLRFPFGACPLLVMVDMREVTFVDAAGAQVLLDAAEAIDREGGRLVIVRGTVRFDWWFALVGLDERLDIVGEPEILSRPRDELAERRRG